MSLEDVKSEYAGTIDASVRGQEALRNLARASRLLTSWSPLFIKKEDLVEIMGEPTYTRDRVLDYVFDHGAVAPVWRFRLSGGEIVGVEYIPGQ